MIKLTVSIAILYFAFFSQTESAAIFNQTTQTNGTEFQLDERQLGDVQNGTLIGELSEKTNQTTDLGREKRQMFSRMFDMGMGRDMGFQSQMLSSRGNFGGFGGFGPQRGFGSGFGEFDSSRNQIFQGGRNTKQDVIINQNFNGGVANIGLGRGRPNSGPSSINNNNVAVGSGSTSISNNNLSKGSGPASINNNNVVGGSQGSAINNNNVATGGRGVVSINNNNVAASGSGSSINNNNVAGAASASVNNNNL